LEINSLQCGVWVSIKGAKESSVSSRFDVEVSVGDEGKFRVFGLIFFCNECNDNEKRDKDALQM
jgi:hypothetical protein